MKIPEPKKSKSGKWFIQLRLGGKSIYVSNYDKNTCIREARAIKAEHQIGKRQPKEKDPADALTLTQAIDRYIQEKENTVSPSTIRGYRAIQKHRFEKIMQLPLSEVLELNWQKVVNTEALYCSPKYLKNAYSFINSVVRYIKKKSLPDVKMPAVPPSGVAFLMPDEILKFVDAVKDTKIAVPALLALSSMRISEISALDWKDIPPDPDFIRTTGAVVRDEFNGWTRKSTGKNETSTRNVPILIPELKAAIERCRKPSGPVLDVKQETLLNGVHRICRAQQITDVTVHGLRHSFASLAYHLQMPEKIAQEIGGWKDSATMHKVYTHIAQHDIERYKVKIADFYSRTNTQEGQNAHKNATSQKKH